jgi:hypothetical protein
LQKSHIEHVNRQAKKRKRKKWITLRAISTESISVIGLSADNNLVKAAVLGHARSCLNGKIQKRLSIGMHKRPHKSSPL